MSLYYFIKALPFIIIAVYPILVLYSFAGPKDLEFIVSESSSESGESESMAHGHQWFKDDGTFGFVTNRNVRQETVEKMVEIKRVSDLYDKPVQERKAAEMEEEL